MESNEKRMESNEKRQQVLLILEGQELFYVKPKH